MGADMSCSICGEHLHKRIYCGACTNHLLLRPRINVIKALIQLSSLDQSVGAVLGGTATRDVPDTRTGILEARITALRARLEQTNKATLQCQAQTQQLRQQAAAQRQKGTVSSKESAQRHKTVANSHRARSDAIASDIARLETDYMSVFHQTLTMQSRCCGELLQVFMLKKKRKKQQDYDVVLGFNTIPELRNLANYTVAVINSGLERLAYFVVLLASYLGIRLPFAIGLPRKSVPGVTLGPADEPLVLEHSVKTLMRTAPKEFHHYCRVLAMLCLDTAYLCGRLGLPNIDVAAMTRPGNLVAQLYLRLEAAIRAGHQIQVHAVALASDVDSIQDHLISAINVDVNGGSAEWNIVDAP